MAEARRAAVWSADALEDRENIWNYYVGAAGRHTAERILRQLGQVIALIEDHPFAGRARNEVRGSVIADLSRTMFAGATIYGRKTEYNTRNEGHFCQPRPAPYLGDEVTITIRP